jgi:alanine racemase
LALYGYDPIDDSEDGEFISNSPLQPALQLFSTIISIQNLQANEVVSYNASYLTTKETNIGIIPFGYFEGLDRRLSNKAQFRIVRSKDKIWVKIAGKVCMNITCLDLEKNDVRRGDQVMLISDEKNDPNSAQSLAKLMGTIPYEVLVKLQANISREIIW